MYKLIQTGYGQNINIIGTNIHIPFFNDNVDYQQFKKDIANGVELQDANGNLITGDALTEFLQGLK
jgi:hypothetical protein